MQSLFFWNTWNKPHRNFYFFTLILLIISLVLLAIAWFRGLENVITWDVLSELNERPLVLDRLSNTDSLGVQAKAYFVTEQFLAPPMQINQTATWLFSLCWLLGIVVLITAISAMRNIWFYVGMASVMFVLASLRMEAFFGLTGYSVSLLLIALYAGLAFYFNAFKPDFEPVKRFYSFLALTVVLVGIGFGFGSLHLHLATYSLPSAMILTLGFVFWISFEIVNGLLFMATSNRSSNALTHFSVLSLIYLGNVMVLFLQNTKSISWQLFTFSPFLLFLTSLVLGIWGLKKREMLIENSMPFDESGAFIYTGGGIISVATMTFAFATANDPLIESLEDTIVYTHLAMGILFFFYVFFNFSLMFGQGLEVHKVVFKPRFFSLYAVRGVAVVLIFSLVNNFNYFPVFQGVAGYYNSLGDLHTSTGELKTAEIYYQQALRYEFQNHKSNYSIASLALTQGDNTTAGGYFRQALLKQPSEYAYAGLGSCLLKENLFFDAVFALKEGLKKFPQSGELQNNLGFLYDKTSVADSAYYFYEQATQNARRPEVAEANVASFWVRNPDLLTSDLNTFLSKKSSNPYPSVQANLLALANIKRTALPTGLKDNWIPKDSALNIMQFACLYNKAIAQVSAIQPDNRQQAILPLLSLANREANSDFYSDLLFANAVQEYYGGDKLVAFDIVSSQAAADTTKTGNNYRATLGIWLAREEKYGDDYASVTSMAGLETALKAHPFNASLLRQFTQFCNTQKQPKQAYEALVTALKFRPDAPALLKLYAMQALEIKMVSYAEEALLHLHDVIPPADYQAFLPQYEAKLALVEKGSETFR